ncbi:Uncharacterised protein [Bordetella pertussis]|nr:Uncharacterised protein [Bordetella pertussis]
MTTVTPAGPAFFWAPANTSPARAMSSGRDRKCEDTSTTSGTSGAPRLAGSGHSVNSTPPMVSLLHRCR